MVDPKSVDWRLVRQSSYLVHQHLRYEYSAPIRDLDHRLMVIPARGHGDQLRVSYRVDVSSREHAKTFRADAFGNFVIEISVPFVEQAIEFDAWTLVERSVERGPHRVHRDWLTDGRLLTPTGLTEPDDELRGVAAGLQQGESDRLELATRINRWVFERMTYREGVSDVRTSAAAALATGQGVCQDYAHVMLALCRLCGLPARYVSGHLIGEGSMHAWVEVLLRSAERPGEGIAYAFDPTHGRSTSLSYLTVAVGRDYADVSPTRGTYRASTKGLLSSQRRVSVTGVEYLEGTAPAA
jgi:transglutaminase-like putative cysteine protease